MYSELRETNHDDQFYVCGDSMGHLLSTTNKKVEDHNVLVMEILVIQEATVNNIQKQMVQVVIE